MKKNKQEIITPILVNYPQTITIITDGNELNYIETKITNKVPILYYQYTKSQTKLNTILPITNEQLEKMILNQIAKIIH